MKSPFLLTLALAASPVLRSAELDKDAYRPHTPTLTYHLANAGDQADAEAIRASVQKLASVRKVIFASGTVQVRFDSHVVSFHQVAHAIAEAGATRNKKYDPTLKIQVPEYAQNGNAAKVDKVFAGKRLNQRVRIDPLDKSQGLFILHFLPLTPDPKASGPQGFNGGHLHHPIHDPPPRGLGLKFIYEATGLKSEEQALIRPHLPVSGVL